MPSLPEPQPDANDRPPATGRRAVALRYQPATMASPQVVASGRGEVAERIIALAREHDIPIKEDPDLVGLLATLDIGSGIPPELYQAVAEVLVFVYRLNAAQAGRHPGRPP